MIVLLLIWDSLPFRYHIARIERDYSISKHEFHFENLLVRHGIPLSWYKRGVFRPQYSSALLN